MITVKVITNKDNRDLLGVHMIGPHVTDLISEAALAKYSTPIFGSLITISPYDECIRYKTFEGMEKQPFFLYHFTFLWVCTIISRCYLHRNDFLFTISNGRSPDCDAWG